MRHQCFSRAADLKTAMNNSELVTLSFNQQKKAFRTPQRISITLPYGTYQRLVERSDLEGRSLSNLAAFLLESAIECQQHRRNHAA